MISYCEMLAGPQQFNLENDLREFILKIENVDQILNEYNENDTVNKYTTEFEFNIQYNGIFMEQTGTTVIDLEQNCINLLAPIQTIIALLNDAQQILVENILGKWKRDQILFLYGPNEEKEQAVWTQDIKYRFQEHKNELDEIQKHFEKLFNCVWSTNLLLSGIQNCHNRHNYVAPVEVNARHDVNLILQKLILASFVVTKQPRQVIHENVNFNAIVRLLLGKHVTDYNKPLVWILSETQVLDQHLHHEKQQQEKQLLTPKNEKLNEIGHEALGFELKSLSFECNLKDMELEKIRINSRKDVLDEKFLLQFCCRMEINHKAFDIWTQSLPVTITSNTSQAWKGWATITWDNSFFAIGRNSFAVPETVPWWQMEWVLSTRFYYQTGCYLTQQHLQYLYKKVFGNQLYDRFELISWKQFAKKKTLNSTFFQWFFEATKLVRLHLSKEWKRCLIAGFISKEDAAEIVRNSSKGSFLLRFSDSQLGGISVCSYTIIDGRPLDVDHMKPYVNKDFEYTNPPCTIGDMIRSLEYYTHVYPANQPKDEAFKAFYSPPLPRTGPYSHKKRSN